MSAGDIALKKSEGCLHQVVQRDIPVFTDSILTAEEMANIVYEEIMKLQVNHSSVSMTNGIYEETMNIEKLGNFVTRFV
jgi:hypothetical protein